MNNFKIYGVFLFLIQNIIFIHMFPVLENHLKMLYNNTKDVEIINTPIKKIEVAVIKSPRQDEDGGDEGNLVSSIAQTLTGVANNVFTDNFKFGNALAESAQILPGDAGETVSGFLNSVAEPINAVVGNPFQQFQEYLDQNFPVTTSTPKPKPKAPTTKPPTIPTTRAPTVSHVFFVHKPPTSVPPLIPIKPSLPNKSGGSTISLAASISSLPINEQGGGAYKRPIYSPPKVEESPVPVANAPVVATSSPNTQLPTLTNSKNPTSSNQPSLTKTEGGTPLNSNVPTISNKPVSNAPQLSDIQTEAKNPVFSSKPLSSNPATISGNLMNSNMPIFANSKPVSTNQLIVSNTPTFSNNPIGSISPPFSNNPIRSNPPNNPVSSNPPTFSRNPIGTNSPTFSNPPLGSNNPTYSNSPGNTNNPTFSNLPGEISNAAPISNTPTFTYNHVSPNKQSTDSPSKTKFSQLLLNNNQPTTKSPLSGNNVHSFSELLLAGKNPSSISNSLLREQSPSQNSNEATFTNNAANLNQQGPNQLANTNNAANLNQQIPNQLTNINNAANDLTNPNDAANLNQQISNANVQVESLFNRVSHEGDRQQPLNGGALSQSLNAISAAMSNNVNTATPTGNVGNNVVGAPPPIHVPNNNVGAPPANFLAGSIPNSLAGGLPPNYNGSSILPPHNHGNPLGLYPIPQSPPGEDEDDDEDGEDEDGNNRVA